MIKNKTLTPEELKKFLERSKSRIARWIKLGYEKKLSIRHKISIQEKLYHKISAVMNGHKIAFDLGIVFDCVTRDIIFVKDANTGFESYFAYQLWSNAKEEDKKNYLSYSIRNGYFCEILKQRFFSKDSARLISKNRDGLLYARIVCHEYAKEQAKINWWRHKETGDYYDHQYDYNSYCAYKKAPRFWRAPGPTDAIGFEFELAFANYENKICFADEIKKNYRPCICEKDGSLDGGAMNGPSLELITPPLPPTEAISLMTSIFPVIKKYGGHVPDDGYAMHVTFNLMGAADHIQAGERFMKLINLRSLRTYWETVARRESKVNPNTGRNYCKFENRAPYMDINVWTDRWSRRPVNHYWATFLRQTGASIEVRICKSTVDFSEFYHTISILLKAWEFAKSEQPLTAKNWISYINPNNTNK